MSEDGWSRRGFPRAVPAQRRAPAFRLLALRAPALFCFVAAPDQTGPQAPTSRLLMGRVLAKPTAPQLLRAATVDASLRADACQLATTSCGTYGCAEGRCLTSCQTPNECSGPSDPLPGQPLALSPSCTASTIETCAATRRCVNGRMVSSCSDNTECAQGRGCIEPLCRHSRMTAERV